MEITYRVTQVWEEIEFQVVMLRQISNFYQKRETTRSNLTYILLTCTNGKGILGLPLIKASDFEFKGDIISSPAQAVKLVTARISVFNKAP